MGPAGRGTRRGWSETGPVVFERGPEILNSVTFSKGLQTEGKSDLARILLFRRFRRQMVRILDFCKENCKETDPPTKWILGGQEVPSRFVRPRWPELDWREWPGSRASKRVAKGSPVSLGSLMEENHFV